MFTQVLNKSLLVLAILAVAACVGIDSSRRVDKGMYKWGLGDNADYIFFGPEKLYVQFTKSTDAVGITVAPFYMLIASGEWDQKDGFILLTPKRKCIPMSVLYKLKLEEKNGVTHLLPIGGANWMPADGYIRVYGADSAVPTKFLPR